MLQEADERCRNKTEPDAMDLFYDLAALIGMSIEEERIYRYLRVLQLKELWASLLSSYRVKEPNRKETSSQYLSLPQLGLQLLLDPSGSIQTIFLYLSSLEGFTPFTKSLPESLNFPSTRPELQSLLGEPLESGITQEGFLSEREEVWDVFQYLDVKIHAGYHSTDQQITRLTFSRFSLKA
jgi:hypothetical protein